MVAIEIGLLFLLGLCFGSFINCLVYRWNHQVSIFKGRSFCPKCKKQINWYDNIPVISFVMLRGCCRRCHSPISWQYPIVELTSAILTLIIFNFSTYGGPTVGWQFLIFNLLLTYCLLAIFISDLIYMTIPDEVVIFGVIVSLIFLISQYPNILISNLISATGAGLFFYLLYLITKGKGMGMGDVKLALLTGLILGWPKIMIALYLAFLTGAIIGVILILIKRKKFGQVIPFGPFLALSTWITMLFGDKIWLVFLNFFKG